MVACLLLDPRDASRERPSNSACGTMTTLETIARACSPRVEPHGQNAVIFDADGLSRVCGPPAAIASDVTALAASQSLTVRVALAATRTAAWILAHARSGTTVVVPGGERDALASLPVGWLGTVGGLDQVRSTKYEVRKQSRRTASGVRRPEGESQPVPEPVFRRGTKHGERGRHHYRLAPAPAEATTGYGVRLEAEPHAVRSESYAERRTPYADVLSTLARWGLRTCGDLASLPRADIHARLGPAGMRLHQAACGEDVAPLTPIGEMVPFTDRMELEWPIDGLEPLSFVLSRQFDRLSTELERADRGAVTITTRLTLTTRDVHERVLNLPAPMREPRVLRTLVLLDLEAHPPSAGIDVVELVLGVTPGRIVQGSLLSRALPSPEDLATLVARLGALMGESRIGAPVLLDTYDARPVAMKPFSVDRLTAYGTPNPEPRTANRTGNPEPGTRNRHCGFRRFPLPLSVRVTVERGAPAHVDSAARTLSGAVVQCAGPWRTSGDWWVLDGGGWDRDGWDAQLRDGVVCRLTRDRVTGAWHIEGVFD